MIDPSESFADLIFSLSFTCYCYNRERSPDIKPLDWEAVFGKYTNEFERLYQQGRRAKIVSTR